MAIRLGIIFDGPVHCGSRTGDLGASTPGARAFLGRAVLEFEVVILSPRFATGAGLKLALDWSRREFGDITDEMRFAPGFPEVDVLLSGEAIQFAGEFPPMAEVRRLRRWRP